MKISARNVIRGKVSALNEGPINAEVEITTPNGDKIIAILTDTSVKSLGLSAGADAVAVIKASWVTLIAGTPEFRFSARNQLPGKVSKLKRGAINTQAAVTLTGGTVVNALVTNEAADELALQENTPVIALFKASHVLVGVPA